MLNLYERQYRTSPRTNNSLQQQQEMRLFRANRSSVEPKNDNDSKNNLKSTMVKESNESKNQQQQEMRLFRANQSSVEPKNDNDSKNNLKSTMVRRATNPDFESNV
jgi:hypothetical protein